MIYCQRPLCFFNQPTNQPSVRPTDRPTERLNEVQFQQEFRLSQCFLLLSLPTGFLSLAHCVQFSSKAPGDIYLLLEQSLRYSIPPNCLDFHDQAAVCTSSVKRVSLLYVLRVSSIVIRARQLKVRVASSGAVRRPVGLSAESLLS